MNDFCIGLFLHFSTVKFLPSFSRIFSQSKGIERIDNCCWSNVFWDPHRKQYDHIVRGLHPGENWHDTQSISVINSHRNNVANWQLVFNGARWNVWSKNTADNFPAWLCRWSSCPINLFIFEQKRIRFKPVFMDSGILFGVRRFHHIRWH